MPPARRSARNTSSTAARESAHPYTRANRQTSPPRSSASIARPANGKTSLRLTVKAAPSKLRQATSGSQIASIPPNPYADASESDATPAPAVRTVRATRNPRTVVEPESDEEEDEEEEQDEDEGMDDEEDDEGEEQDEDAEGEDEELEDAEESEEDAEDDEDEDMSDAIAVQEHPPPPIIKTSNAAGRSKPNVTVTAPEEGAMKSVEEKEMDEEDDEQELSELDSNENEEEEEEEEGDDDLDSDDDEGSRSATPDLSKLTRRQRGIYEEEESTGLMSLSNEAQKKKHLTAEEHAMRRAEMARRRKNLSEKRNEEEKVNRPNPLPLPFSH